SSNLDDRITAPSSTILGFSPVVVVTRRKPFWVRAILPIESNIPSSSSSPARVPLYVGSLSILCCRDLLNILSLIELRLKFCCLGFWKNLLYPSSRVFFLSSLVLVRAKREASSLRVVYCCWSRMGSSSLLELRPSTRSGCKMFRSWSL